jgi:nucleoid-associated protein YgaU
MPVLPGVSDLYYLQGRAAVKAQIGAQIGARKACAAPRRVARGALLGGTAALRSPARRAE